MGVLEYALYAELTKEGTTLDKLIGGRVRPLFLPQNSPLPAVVYQRVSTPRYAAMQKDTPLSSPRIQIDCYAQSYPEAISISEALREILQDFSGTMGEGDNTVENVAVLLQDQQELYEEQTKYWRIMQDYIIYHNETQEDEEEEEQGGE